MGKAQWDDQSLPSVINGDKGQCSLQWAMAKSGGHSAQEQSHGVKNAQNIALFVNNAGSGYLQFQASTRQAKVGLKAP